MRGRDREGVERDSFLMSSTSDMKAPRPGEAQNLKNEEKFREGLRESRQKISW
jgi:hypothetical protein